jgi:hypothetical protein
MKSLFLKIGSVHIYVYPAFLLSTMTTVSF